MKYINHKKANQKYTRQDCFEAGIKLNGQEVKSVKASQGSLEGSYVIIRGGEAFIIGLTIPPWQPANIGGDFESNRNRTLLLHKKELSKLVEYDQKPGFALIPFSLYNKGGLIKVEVCISKNKQEYDHRNEIKKRDTERDLNRTLKI